MRNEAAQSTKSLTEYREPHEYAKLNDPYVLSNRFFGMRFRRRIPLGDRQLRELKARYRNVMKDYGQDAAILRGIPEHLAKENSQALIAAYETFADAERKTKFDYGLVDIYGSPQAGARLTHERHKKTG